MTELRQFIKRLADEPTKENQLAFYQAFLNSQVAIPTQTPPPVKSNGESTETDANSQWVIPRTTIPDGSPMLLVFSDPKSALRTPQAKGGFSLAGKVVLEMALANQVGIIVSCSGDGDADKPSWAGVPRDHVSWILSNCKLMEQSEPSTS